MDKPTNNLSPKECEIDQLISKLEPVLNDCREYVFGNGVMFDSLTCELMDEDSSVKEFLAKLKADICKK